ANAAYLAHPALKEIIVTDGRSDVALQLDGRVGADDLEVIAELCVLGEGIAWLPDFLVENAVKAGKLARVLPHWRPKNHELATYHWVHAGRRYALPKVEAFVQTASEMLGAARGTERARAA